MIDNVKTKCDICNKETINLDTVVFYDKTITYCDECENKVIKAKLDFKKDIKYQNVLFDIMLKNKEKKLIKELKRGTEKLGTEIFV